MSLKERFLEIDNKFRNDKDYWNKGVVFLSVFCASVFTPRVMKDWSIIGFIAQVFIHVVFYFTFLRIFVNLKKFITKVR